MGDKTLNNESARVQRRRDKQTEVARLGRPKKGTCRPFSFRPPVGIIRARYLSSEFSLDYTVWIDGNQRLIRRSTGLIVNTSVRVKRSESIQNACFTGKGQSHVCCSVACCAVLVLTPIGPFMFILIAPKASS